MTAFKGKLEVWKREVDEKSRLLLSPASKVLLEEQNVEFANIRNVIV
jgi:hypothetical protein